MKIKTLFFLFFIPLILLTGCPYESTVPLYAPEKAVIDARFIGIWKLAEEKDGDKGTIEILNFNDHELLVLLREENSEKIEKARAFVSQIKGMSYLNFQDIDMKPGKKHWMILKYRFSGDTLLLNTVEDDLFTQEINSSRKLRSFFKKNQHKKEFLDMEDLVLVRAN